MICECYHAEKNFLGKVGSCWGTAERDACSCGGDKSKCDFYPSVRAEKKPATHYDRIISKTPEELAEFLTTEDMCELICAPVPPHCDGQCKQKMLDWLKQEAKE